MLLPTEWFTAVWIAITFKQTAFWRFLYVLKNMETYYWYVDTNMSVKEEPRVKKI